VGTLIDSSVLVAATAIAAGYRVATRDRRSFDRIPGLDVHLLD